MTKTGKIPANVGHSKVSGVTRTLTKREVEQQKELQKLNKRP